MDEKKSSELTRRDIIRAATVAGAGVILAGCTPQTKTYPSITFAYKAPDGAPLKAGLVGCGGRGSGAAVDFLKAGPNLKISAMADVFEDHLKSCREKLAKEANVQVADDHCFVGFDAYKRLLESDLDIVLLATPPHFRPEHANAAISPNTLRRRAAWRTAPSARWLAGAPTGTARRSGATTNKKAGRTWKPCCATG